MNQDSEDEETKQVTQRLSNSELKRKKLPAKPLPQSQRIIQQQEKPNTFDDDDLGIPMTENLDQPDMRLRARPTPVMRNSFSSQDGSFVGPENRKNLHRGDSNGPRDGRGNSAAKRSGNLKELLQRIPSGQEDRRNSSKSPVPTVINRNVSQPKSTAQSNPQTNPKGEQTRPKQLNPAPRLEDPQLKKRATSSKHPHSRVDNNALKHAFASFQQTFETQIDLYYKNYNRYIQEHKNKMEVYVKATKKERRNYQQFLNREETTFWKDFPREKKFYHENLHKIREIFDFKLEGSHRRQSPTSTQQPDDVRDIDEMVRTILDYLPFGSRKYCQQFNLEHCPLLSSEASRKTATFDSLTQSLRMFDTDNIRNWQILGFVVSILASDVLALLLERRPAPLGAGSLLPIVVSSEMTEVLIQYCRRFAQNNMAVQPQTDEEDEEYTIVDILFDQVQFIWANQIFPKLSMLSKHHFDACLKMMQLPLQIQLRKATEDEVQEATQEIFFCRYLVIVPTDIRMGDKVLNLLEKFLHVLSAKSGSDADEVFKHGMLATLKYLVENLCFYDVAKQSKASANIVPAKGLSFEPQAMQMLENRVSKIYFVAESLSKKDSLREYAHYLMATILKVETEDFVEQNLSKFLTAIKFNQFFQSKKTYHAELKLVNQLYYSGAVQLQRYKAWKPKIYAKSILLIDDSAAGVVLPFVTNVAHQDHFMAGRKVYMPTLNQNQLPLGLSQPNEQPRVIIQSVSDLFRLIFNPKLLHIFNDGCAIDFSHWQFLEQASFDDFEFISKSGIESLLEQRYSERHVQMVNLGLKLAHYVLDPTGGFRERYLRIHGGVQSYKGARLEQQLRTMKQIVGVAIRDILTTSLRGTEQNQQERKDAMQISALANGGFRRSLDFFKLQELKTLCNDQQQVIWSRINTENFFVRPAAISKELKKQKQGKFHLQEQQRLISFEDLNEIEKQDFKYSDGFLNSLSNELAATVGQAVDDDVPQTVKSLAWDKKKEAFIRHRLLCYVSEVDNIQSNSSPTTSFVGVTANKKDIPMQRQNTAHYGKVNPKMHEALKQLKLILKMAHYMPDLHEFFRAYPMRTLVKDQHRFLTERVNLVKQAEKEASVLTPPKQDQRACDKQEPKQKFSEVERLLPYLALSLDFRVAEKAIKCLTKMMVFSKAPMRVALVDQMVYFIKELMLESTDEGQLAQFCQILLNMVRVWHHTEKVKVQLNQAVSSGQKLLEYQVINIDEADDQDKSRSFHEIAQHSHVFDYLDMIGIISICNKNALLRSIGCLLLVEAGKLKRLLIHRDKHRQSISDICYLQKDAIQESLLQKLSTLSAFTTEGAAPLAKLKQQIAQSPWFFFQLMVDTFEYQKLGLWESYVRDIQVLFIGDLTRLWKINLLTNSKYGGVTMNFVQVCAGRTLQLYENKQDGALTVGVEKATKDSVGFNILLAAVLSNMTKSHSNNMLQVAVDDGEEFQAASRLISNTLVDDAKAMIGLIETGLGQIHKIALGSLYPARITTSNVLATFLYYLQTPSVDQQSYEHLREVFSLKKIDLALGKESEAKDDKERARQLSFAQNCILFQCLLALNANEHFLAYIYDQVGTLAGEGKAIVSLHLKELSHILVQSVESTQFDNDAEGKRKTTVKICLAHAICIAVKRIRDFCEAVDQLQSFDATVYLPVDYQGQLLKETRAQFNTIAKSPEMEWLAPKIKQIWFCLLSFENIFQPQIKAQLDLKFLISLEQEGFTDALKYFKHFSLFDQTSKSAALNEQSRANEIKLLIQHVYSFYATPQIQPYTQSQQMQSNMALVRKNLPDSLFLLAQRDAGSRNDESISLNQYLQQNSTFNRSESSKIHQKNIFFKCFINHVVDVDAMQRALEGLQVGQPGDFEAVYLPVVNSVFRYSKISLAQKIRKFTQANMHSKYFLMSLLISLNTVDKVFIEKSKVLALSLLPLMFSDSGVESGDGDSRKLSYRKIVEEKIAQNASNIRQLVNFENKAFYQFIKRTFVDEELFNMQFNFEKYFSVSGFLRDILNEIIKLQNGDFPQGPGEGGQDKDKQSVPPKMMLKVLDIITYFFSGHLDLRRAPHAHNAVIEPRQREYASVPQQQKNTESFIFANLIDYKSFEFLSKLYKVSEKLVDHDSEMLVMNMWYKICENRPHNFEILAKFLVHNLSSFIMKLKTTSSSNGSASGSTGKAVEADLQSQITGLQIKSSSGTNTDSIHSQQDIAYGVEYEKQKRYSLSIFNYIKARTQQVDLRNSLNLTSISWSQRMIKLVIHAQLNLQSKYALEKMKLKKVLEVLHAEINHSEIRSLINDRDAKVDDQLKQILMVGSDSQLGGPVNQSVSMERLLQSQTFLAAFGVKHQTDSSTIKQMLFILSRQMAEHFQECTPDSQIAQLPDLIIKYFENSLILIANEAERLQIIKFTQKDEIAITILVLLLIADLASQTANNDINRCYFIFDLLNKLAMSIPGVQKYLKLQTMSIEQFTSLTSEEDLLQIFNYRNVYEIFALFTSTYFKVIHNVVAITAVHTFMIKFWLLVQQKVANLNVKTHAANARPSRLVSITDLESVKPLYTRKQTIEMLQGCFKTLQFVSMRAVKGDPSTSVASQKLLKSTMQNFLRQLNCLFEFVQPPNTKAFSLREMAEAVLFDPDVAFPVNAVFWVTYLCLEATAIVQSKSCLDNMLLDEVEDARSFKVQLLKLQESAIGAMRRILEDSDFFKLLINLQEVSQDVLSYSLSLRQRKTALLSLIFLALENPKCASDAYQILITSIRVQDHSLLTAGGLQEDLANDELHRLLLLLPFFNQQFLGEPLLGEGHGLRQSSTMFPSPRAMIQLLKKSMLSIAIDKKKDVESILDEIQQLADQSDAKAINDHFAKLISATVESCIAQSHTDVATECIRTFKGLQEFGQRVAQEEDSNGSKHVVIEHQILADTILEIQKVLQSRDIPDDEPLIYCQSKELFSIGPKSPAQILGEQPINVHEELRSLYFGIKNIVLLEIQHSIKELQISDVKQFFGFQTNVQNRVSIPSQQANNEMQRPSSLHEMEIPSKLKQLGKKSEMFSKYQNSQNANNSPSNLRAQTSQPAKISTPFRMNSLASQNNFSVLPEGYLSMNKRNSDTQTLQKAQPEDPKAITEKKIAVLDQSNLESHAKQKEHLSQILFADESSEEYRAEFQQERVTGQSFAENVMNEDQRVRRDQQQFYPQQQMGQSEFDRTEANEGQEIEGLIGTFAKPSKRQSPKSQIAHFTNNAQEVQHQGGRSPGQLKSLRGEIPAPKMGGLVDGSQAISSISYKPTEDFKQPGKAFTKGFTEDDRIDESFAFTEHPQSNQDFQFEQRPPKSDQRAKWMQSENLRTQELQHTDGRLTGYSEKRDPFYSSAQPQGDHRKKRQFVDHENMPTPKNSSEMDSLLVEIINDQDRFYLLEEFLCDVKHYDMDNLAFYVKVMEFKKESSQSNCALAAGLIIDNYLSEDADYYIGNSIEDESAIERLITNYEVAVLNQMPCPKNLFDDIAQKVRDELTPYLREFSKLK